ncbi:MAG: hypothetical protein RR661_00595, partial [Anaerovoracaceae bacterium]
LTGAVAEHNPAEGLMIIEQLTQGGKDTRQILQGWMSHYRNLLMTKFIKNPEDVLNMSVENIQRIREQSEMLSLTEINRAIIELSATIVQSRNSTKPRVLLEICMVKLATDISDGPVVIKQAIGQVAPVAVGGASPRAQETAAKEPSQISLQPQKAQQQMPAQQQPAKAKSAEPDDWELSMQRFNQQEIREQLEEDDFVPVFPSTGGGAGSIIGQAAQGESPKPKPTTLATPQAEPKPLATESGAETQAQNQAQNQNITGIWTAFLEDGEQTIGGMFGMVRNGAKPINITETEFIITAKGMAKAFIEKNKSKLEDMLEKYTGQRKLLKIVSETQEEEKKGIQEIAVKAEAFLGIKVDIE